MKNGPATRVKADPAQLPELRRLTLVRERRVSDRARIVLAALDGRSCTETRVDPGLVRDRRRQRPRPLGADGPGGRHRHAQPRARARAGACRAAARPLALLDRPADAADARGRGRRHLVRLAHAQLEKKGYAFRRPRHTLKGRQDAHDVRRARLRLWCLELQAEARDIDLLY